MRKPKSQSFLLLSLLPFEKNPRTLLPSEKKKTTTTKETTKTQIQTQIGDQSRNHTKQEINHEPSDKPNRQTHEPANLGGEPKQQNPQT